MPCHYSKIKVKTFVVLFGETSKRNVSTPLVAAKLGNWGAEELLHMHALNIQIKGINPELGLPD